MFVFETDIAYISNFCRKWRSTTCSSWLKWGQLMMTHAVISTCDLHSVSAVLLQNWSAIPKSDTEHNSAALVAFVAALSLLYGWLFPCMPCSSYFSHYCSIIRKLLQQGGPRKIGEGILCIADGSRNFLQKDSNYDELVVNEKSFYLSYIDSENLSCSWFREFEKRVMFLYVSSMISLMIS